MKLPIVLCILSLLAFPPATAAQSPTAPPTPTASTTFTATPTGSPTATAGAPTESATPTDSPTSTEQPATEPAPTQTPFVVTATPAALPTAAPPQPDSYEPNNSGGTAAPLNLPAQVEKLSFYPLGDRDYFRFVVKPSQLGLTLTLDTYAEVGIDTVISLLGSDGGAIASNDDVSPTEPRSHLALPAQPGEYIVVIDNHATGRPDFKTYRLEIGLVAPRSGETPPPSAPQPGGDWDQYGGTNFTWESAAEIAVGEEVAGLTFGCPAWEAGRANCTVPDFFKLAVKAGSCYEAETSITPGVDTNLIVYSDQRDGAAPLSGNDDRAHGDFSSAAVFCAGYTGAAYLLVGQVGNIAPPPPIGQRTYGLLVTIWALAPPPTPTMLAPPAAQADPATQAVPAPPTRPGVPSDPIVQPVPAPAAQGVPAPTPAELPISGVLVEEINVSQPVATVIPLVGTTLGVLACYDRNLNQACDVDEGIAGLAVYVALDSGELLAQAITDQNGRAQLTIRVVEDASLVISVPTFAAVQTVSARRPQIRPIVVKTVAAIPALIP